MTDRLIERINRLERENVTQRGTINALTRMNNTQAGTIDRLNPLCRRLELRVAGLEKSNERAQARIQKLEYDLSTLGQAEKVFRI